MKESYAGRVIKDRYRIIRELSSSEEDDVLLAEDVIGGKIVSMRIIPYNYQDAEAIREAETMFQNQLDVLCRLEHKGLPMILEGFTEKMKMCIVTEHHEGRSLEQMLMVVKQFSQEDVQKWALEILRVIDYLHSRYPPVIFRDLKPENILIKNDGTVELINFGLARTYKPFKTQDTVVRGSKGYAAPEQYGGRGQTDAKADIYSFGVTVHRMLTGHDPSKSPFNLPPLSSLRSDLWPGWQSIISKATELKSENRYKTARDLLRDIQGLTEQHSENGGRPAAEQKNGPDPLPVPQSLPFTGRPAVRAEKPQKSTAPVMARGIFLVIALIVILCLALLLKPLTTALAAAFLAAIALGAGGYFLFFRKR
ncbi:MAG: serine/threonine-protein kinase [Candidatus Eremiobacteraeota bacterium]|nr:serine/threonine-protein kinase [Candidatus Eremiobacteraeota bacterium]